MSDNNNLQNFEAAENSNSSIELNQNDSEKEITETQIINSINNEVEDINILNEIDEANAEDAEDEGHKDRHNIELKAYDTFSLEELTNELENLLKTQKVQAIKKHVEAINSEFKTKFNTLFEYKKDEFINEGGQDLDFYFDLPVQKRFKTAYNDYRKKLNDHYKDFEQSLKQNLSSKLEIIEEIKKLLHTEGSINSTYKQFKDLQERWKNTGPIPKDKYNNAWNSYHHHVELFYDYLHLDRDFRDLDFKHNLEKKLLIIERAEKLSEETDVLAAFRELQELHKIWKEDIGPVSKEHRVEIWDRFKAATKKINDKRQVYFLEIDKIHEKNLEHKLEIIAKIEAINAQEKKSHNDWQNQIKAIEALRNQFFNAGKVPLNVNEKTWASFKIAVKEFNKQKNSFYKNQKQIEFENLTKKKELIKIAEDNKDNDDFETTTPLMIKIQNDWKKIGHVPKKDSTEIWKQFKNACNHYFERVNSLKNAANKELLEAFNNKTKLLESLKDFTPSSNKEEDISKIKNYINQWKSFGKVPKDKTDIDGKFQKAVDNLFSSLNIEKDTIEMIKFESKLEILTDSSDSKNIDNERAFIRKRIDEVKSQINQLENNLQFFTNPNAKNPLIDEVRKNIKNQKDELNLWKEKLKKIKSII